MSESNSSTVQFHAAYQLDGVKASLGKLSEKDGYKDKIRALYKNLSSFELSAPFDIGEGVRVDPHPIWCYLATAFAASTRA